MFREAWEVVSGSLLRAIWLQRNAHAFGHEAYLATPIRNRLAIAIKTALQPLILWSKLHPESWLEIRDSWGALDGLVIVDPVSESISLPKGLTL
jgi:hypothetical protein